MALFFIALILSAAFDPLVDWLQAKKIPRALSILGVYIIFIALIAGVIYSLAGPVKDQIFEIGGPEEMTMKEMLQRTAKFLGKKRIFIPIPKILVKFGAFFLQFLPNPPLNPKAVDFITMDVHLNAESFKKTFPNIHLKTLEEGLRSY